MELAAITGAGGFIGGRLTKRLLERGVKVIGADISADKTERFSGYGNFYAAVSDKDLKASMEKAAAGKRIDVFYHLAWMGYGSDTNNFDVQVKNVVMTHSMAELAAELGCGKFVMADSFHEYQKNSCKNDPSGRRGYCSIYGASKISARAYARAVCHNNDMDFNGAVFSNVYGEGDFSDRTPNLFISKLIKNEPLGLIGINPLYDWVYVDDVAGALEAIGDRGRDGKEYYVGSRIRPFRDIVEELREILSSESELRYGAYDDSTYIDYSEISPYELFADTGYSAGVSLEEGVRKTVGWLRSVGRI